MFLSKNLREGLTAMSADREDPWRYIISHFNASQRDAIFQLMNNEGFKARHRDHEWRLANLLWDAIDEFEVQGDDAPRVIVDASDSDDDDVVLDDSAPLRPLVLASPRRRRLDDPLLLPAHPPVRPIVAVRPPVRPIIADLARRRAREEEEDVILERVVPSARRRHTSMERGERDEALRLFAVRAHHEDPISSLGQAADDYFPFQHAMVRERLKRGAMKGDRVYRGMNLESLHRTLFGADNHDLHANILTALRVIGDRRLANEILQEVPHRGPADMHFRYGALYSCYTAADAMWGIGAFIGLAYTWFHFLDYYVHSVRQEFLPHEGRRMRISVIGPFDVTLDEWPRFCRKNDEILSLLHFTHPPPIRGRREAPTVTHALEAGENPVAHTVMLRLRKIPGSFHRNGFPVFEVDVYDSAGIMCCTTLQRDGGHLDPLLDRTTPFSDTGTVFGYTAPVRGSQWLCTSFLQVLLNDMIYPYRWRIMLQQALGLTDGVVPLEERNSDQVRNLLDQNLVLVHPLSYQGDPRIGDRASCLVHTCFNAWYFATQEEARHVDLEVVPHGEIIRFRNFMIDTLALVNLFYENVEMWHEIDDPEDHEDGTNGFGVIS